MSNKRVVITGAGVVSPIGNNLETFWNGLISGKNGAGLITKFDAEKFTSKVIFEVKDFDFEGVLDIKEARRMDIGAQYALVAAAEAAKNSGLDFSKIDPERAGCISGSGIGGIKSFETEHEKYLNAGPRRVSPFFIVQMIIDIVPGLISIKHNLKGPNYSCVSACATASHSIGDAYYTIQRGDADIMFTGGSEGSISPMAIAGFNSMKALSTRNDDYMTASRPFDKDRDGFVMGEGAGILILEEYEHAKARGANIIAEITGVGFTGDAYHVTAPAPGGEGAVRAMKKAIKDSGMKPEDVNYINAHGTSTPFNDKNESAAIKTVFGDHAYKLNVSSTKSMTGHLLGAAGAIEAIATAMAVKNDIIPPTINLQNPDPECDLNYTANKAQEKEVNAAISNTFGFGGHNACIMLKKV